MNTSPDNRVSRVAASAAARSRHLQTVVLMSTFEHANVKAQRILVPINASEDSRWGVRYALHRRSAGASVEVILLNVGEPVVAWEVLRFRTQHEIGRFQSERAQAFIDDASEPLVAANVPCRGIFKQGEVVFSILDTAEELDCDEIAMPEPNRGLPSIFSRDIVDKVIHQKRDIPVVAVNGEGMPSVPNGGDSGLT